MNTISAVRSLLLVLTVSYLAGCGGGSSSSPSPTVSTALSSDNINLIFVVTPDLVNNTPGDVNPDTANLTSQGLQRSLMMATYLKQQLLGEKNASRIYALQPMSHLQTAHNFPDMAAIEYIQQFAMLNQVSLTGVGGYNSPLYTANSFPLNTSYADPTLGGQALPFQGLEYDDTSGNNAALVGGLLHFNIPGFYVFSAPWKTVSDLMAIVNAQYGNSMTLPVAYAGANQIYAITLKPKPSVVANLVTYNSNLNPPASYPVLPGPLAVAACPSLNSTPALFGIQAPGVVNGAIIPQKINTNQTMYLIRHAEAHPWSGWDDGNYVAAGQWRALALPAALKGKISPSMVYSIDPAQVTLGASSIAGNSNFSYVRPSLTVAPYAIANSLPYYLVSDINIFDANSPYDTSQFFFFGGQFSNTTILLAWEHNHFPPIITELLSNYFPTGKVLPGDVPKVPAWPGSDYDTIWTVKLDAQGNLTVDNALCEGIDSSMLPVTAPLF